MLKLLRTLFYSKKKKEQIRKELDMHRVLIAEYEKIQNKNSKLNRKKRDEVIETVNDLVAKGHIKAG